MDVIPVRLGLLSDGLFSSRLLGSKELWALKEGNGSVRNTARLAAFFFRWIVWSNGYPF